MTTFVEDNDRRKADDEILEKDFEQRKQLYQTSALGISFSQQNVYFAELIKSDGATIVRKFGVIPTNMKFGSGVEGVEKNVRDLNAYLNGCLVDNNIRAKRMNLSLNTHLVTLQKAVSDEGYTDSEFEDFITWEFGQHVVDGTDQYVINTSALTEPSTMLLVGVRRRIVDTLKSVLDKSKIELSCVDVDILCAHATYETNYEKLHDAFTALVEIKSGISTILLCQDFDIRFVYQFPVSGKVNPQKAGALLSQHLDFMIQDYNRENGAAARVGRVILCNAMAVAAIPHIDSRFRAEVIDPLIQVRLADEYLPKEEPDESGDASDQKKEAVPAADYSMYAECIGAALKLLN